LAGTGVAVEATLLPHLEEPSRALLRKLEYYGISEIEFKRDQRDGRLYLIEINPRHWDQHGLGTAVGVNLSEALYRDATGQPGRELHQSSMRKVWIGDAELTRHIARVLQGKAPAKDLSILFESNKMPSVFSWSDLGPFLRMLGLPARKSRVGDA
jgi:predicted ATP-grasp superfamily ATP-dependent carboligase